MYPESHPSIYADINRGFLLNDDCELVTVGNDSRNARDRYGVGALRGEWIPL